MAAVTSPISASPRQNLLEWDEGAVHSYLVHIGLPQYEELIFGMFTVLCLSQGYAFTCPFLYCMVALQAPLVCLSKPSR